MSYHFENYSPENLNQLIEVFKVGFGQSNVPKSFFLNKFKGTQTRKFIGVIAYESATNIPVGIFGVVAILSSNGRKENWIGQAVDLTIIPDHRKKGLFTPLHEKLMNTCKAEGILLIYALPNEASFRAFTNTGWSYSKDLYLFSKQNALPKYLQIAKKVSPRFYYHYKKFILKKHRTKLVSSIIKLSTTLRKDSNGIAINRTLNYIEYKISQGASLLKFKKGYVLVFLGENEVKIGELFTEDPSKTLRDLVSFVSCLGIQKISYSCSHITINEALEENGIIQTTKSPLTILELNIKDFDHGNFCYTGLDIDTFCIDYS